MIFPVSVQIKLSLFCELLNFSTYLNDDASCAWAIELAEVDTLPSAEHEVPVFYQDLFTGPHERTFAVRIGIAFYVPIAWTILGKQFVECE